MNSHERIITTLNHERPDRIGTFDSYWPEFEVICRDRLGICTLGETNPHLRYL